MSTQPPPVPTAPEKAVPRTYHSVPHSPPDNIELDNLQWGARLTGPVEQGGDTPSGAESPAVPNDLEMIRSTTPIQENEGFEAMQSITNPPMNRYRMLAVCMMNFCMGLNDSAPGALIPYVESYVVYICFEDGSNRLLILDIITTENPSPL
jgi:hypothetical protein